MGDHIRTKSSRKTGIAYKTGDFARFGTCRTAEWMQFTYVNRTTMPSAIVLFDRGTKRMVAQIDVPQDCMMGKVVSIMVTGYDWNRLCYRIHHDGKVENDFYAEVVIGREKWNDSSREAHNFEVYSGFGSGEYEWQDSAFAGVAAEDLILYKLHMRGFTMNHGLGRSDAGNVNGFLKRLPELKELGVTALEFQPLYDFEEVSYTASIAYEKDKAYTKMVPDGRVNYWGYGPASYYAPKASYFGCRPDQGMKRMVDAIHGAGMEMIMEMAFDDRFTSDHEIVSILRHWVREYHVDGFHLLGARLPLEFIAEDPFLAGTRIFNDGFPEALLAKENAEKRLFVDDDQFLYPLRKLQNHMEGRMAELAAVSRRAQPHFGYVNCAANTTGFCLLDAYSYAEKHNEANGEENRDGNNFNYSFNYGVEGPSRNRKLDALRKKHVRTALSAVLLAQGVPMILSGDEVLNTQMGNNNPYCQDNETAWVNFRSSKAREEMRDFVAALIAFRKAHPVLRLAEPMRMNDYRQAGIPDLSYHAAEPWVMGIGPEKKSIAAMYCGAYGEGENTDDILICYNFHYEEDYFALPRLKGRKKWHLWMNTADAAVRSGQEIVPIETSENEIAVPGGSISVLIGW